MKAGACILMFIWSLLLVEPILANFSIDSPYSSCAEKQGVKSSCCKPACEAPAENEEKDDCENNRCNPLMSCPTGNFYLFGHPPISITHFTFAKEKTILVNDNRIIKQSAECWHPPEIIEFFSN